MLGEDSKKLFKAFPVLFGQLQLSGGRVDIIFPIDEARQLQEHARSAKTELVVDETKLRPPAPCGYDLGLNSKCVNHRSSFMRSAKKPCGQRSINSPD